MTWPTAFPKDKDDQWDEWVEQHWSCPMPGLRMGDPATALYYGFHRPTHAIIFLAPFTDLTRLILHQINPAPVHRTVPWILPGETTARPIDYPTSQWPAPKGTP